MRCPSVRPETPVHPAASVRHRRRLARAAVAGSRSTARAGLHVQEAAGAKPALYQNLIFTLPETISALWLALPLKVNPDSTREMSPLPTPKMWL